MSLQSDNEFTSNSGPGWQNCDLEGEFNKSRLSLKSSSLWTVLVHSHQPALLLSLSEWIILFSSRLVQINWRSPHGSSKTSPFFLLTPALPWRLKWAALLHGGTCRRHVARLTVTVFQGDVQKKEIIIFLWLYKSLPLLFSPSCSIFYS